jgi:Raf kinase inhibitor-like YbhB/YbcL family protein
MWPASCQLWKFERRTLVAMVLRSDAFPDGGDIPIKYTCQGDNISPPLTWIDTPAQTRSFALVMDDPDARFGAFTHWLIFDLDPNISTLGEGVQAASQLPSSTIQGKNGFGKIGYGGPCPPGGRPHHYRFTLYALDDLLRLASGSSKKQVLGAIHGHILEQAQLVGLFQRGRSLAPPTEE